MNLTAAVQMNGISLFIRFLLFLFIEMLDINYQSDFGLVLKMYDLDQGRITFKAYYIKIKS